MFGPSKYAYWSGLLLALLCSALVAVWCHWALGGAVLLLLAHEAKRESRTQLPSMCWDERTQRWLDASGNEVVMKALRVGPAIIGVRCNGNTVWLWPDSAPPELLWQLRRSLCCR
ncbi:hypothetical protein [Carnimonas bestiolae]|uniref:hypothetical protein n=1 Tax=Carnimonas bestiolae TaxID=3402172 RepID=UPI003EDB9F55